MSLFDVYFLNISICGLMYRGVPTKLANSSLLKLSTVLEKPKSASLKILSPVCNY